jgi:hypothetical protein
LNSSFSSGEQGHALTQLSLCYSACSCVSWGGEVLWSSGGLAPLVFVCVQSCSYLLLFLCVQVLGARMNKAKHMVKLFQVSNVVPWHSYFGVFLFVHVFLKVLKLYEVLGVLCLLFSCVCDFILFVLVCVCVILFTLVFVFMCVGY